MFPFQQSPFGQPQQQQQQPFGQQDQNFGMNVQFSVGPFSTGLGFQTGMSAFPQQQSPYGQQPQQPIYQQPQQQQPNYYPQGQPQQTGSFNIDQLLGLMMRESYDDEKINVLKANLRSVGSLSCHDVLRVMGLFGYTDHKIQVLLMLYPYVHDRVNTQTIINTFPFDADRQNLQKQLGFVPQQLPQPVYQPVPQPMPQPVPQQVGYPMSDQDFNQLLASLNKESFSDGKHSALGFALKGVQLTSAQAGKVAKVFSFADDKVKALIAMYPRVVDRNNFNSAIQEIPFDSDRQKVRAAIAHL